MRRPSQILVRLTVAVVALLLLLLGVLLLIPDTSPQSPVPFSTNGYFVTQAIEYFPSHLLPHASLQERFWFGYFKLRQIIHPYQPEPTNTTFAAVPFGTQSIEVMLNECTETSGTRYFMPPDIATGTIQFGSSTALDGRQWITACETALQTGMPEILDPHTRSMRPGKLVLIRYPKHKAVLILTATEAEEFRRTNSTGVIDKIPR
jgi:hypothetical protein